MSDNVSVLALIVSFPLGLLLLYAIVRVSAAAYFKSKRQFDLGGSVAPPNPKPKTN